MSIFSSWSKALVGKPWIRLDDAGTVLAGGSPRSGVSRNTHFQADQAHWLSLVANAIARGVIATADRDGIRYVRRTDLRRWCETSDTPWKVPHHPGEDETTSGSSDPLSSAAADQAEHDGAPHVLDPREHTTLLVLIAAAASAGKLDASAIERAASELGVTLSRRTITKHLAHIDDAIERRKDIAR